MDYSNINHNINNYTASNAANLWIQSNSNAVFTHMQDRRASTTNTHLGASDIVDMRKALSEWLEQAWPKDKPKGGPKVEITKITI